MPITIEERYKEMFEQLRFASEIRLKIYAAWGSAYVALAAMFAWMQSSPSVMSLSWIVPFLGIVTTIIFWFADLRNQPAIKAAKDVGAAIEADPAAGILKEQRYFLQLEKGVPFGEIVNAFTVIVLAVLIAATVYLLG